MPKKKKMTMAKAMDATVTALIYIGALILAGLLLYAATLVPSTPAEGPADGGSIRRGP